MNPLNRLRLYFFGKKSPLECTDLTRSFQFCKPVTVLPEWGSIAGACTFGHCTGIRSRRRRLVHATSTIAARRMIDKRDTETPTHYLYESSLMTYQVSPFPHRTIPPLLPAPY